MDCFWQCNLIKKSGFSLPGSVGNNHLKSSHRLKIPYKDEDIKWNIKLMQYPQDSSCSSRHHMCAFAPLSRFLWEQQCWSQRWMSTSGGKTVFFGSRAEGAVGAPDRPRDKVLWLISSSLALTSGALSAGKCSEGAGEPAWQRDKREGVRRLPLPSSKASRERDTFASAARLDNCLDKTHSLFFAYLFNRGCHARNNVAGCSQR